MDGKYLYNRCHLIGFQLAGENANEENLITGTRYMNVEGMLPFEDMVDDYVDDTGCHVLYRVTPIFQGDNLVADGVLMEACSVEDEGAGLSFCVFCYNVQPGVTIDYATGRELALRGGSSCPLPGRDRTLCPQYQFHEVPSPVLRQCESDKFRQLPGIFRRPGGADSTRLQSLRLM